MRAAIYCRISADHTGEGLGVARQEDECRQEADRQGWTVTDVYVDNDVSATTGKPRPGYEALLATLRSGEADAVVAWHPDRLYRRLSDLTRLMDAAGDRVVFRTVQAGEIDLSTPSGRMIASIMGSIATGEVEHKAARQKAAYRQRAERGLPHWSKAFGYINAGGHRRELDPKTAPLVARAYADIIAGGSLWDVARMFNAAGALTVKGGLWDATRVSAFLRNARNAGLRTYQLKSTIADPDKVIGPGSWPGIVSPETYWTAVRVLNAPGRAPGPKRVRRHLLTRMLHCGNGDCGGLLIARWSMRKDGHVITYGCSRCRGVTITATFIEPFVRELITQRLGRSDALELLRTAQHDDTEADALREQANALRARIEALGVDYAEGLLTASQVKTATEALTAKLDAVEAATHDSRRVAVLSGLPLGQEGIAEAVAELSDDRLRAVLDLLATVTVLPIGKNHGSRYGRFDPDERVRVDWHG